MPDSNAGTIRALKTEMRRAAVAHRTAAAAGAPDAAAQLASRFLTSVPIRSDAAVSAFWPMSAEIDIRPLLTTLHHRGHICCLPATGPRGQPLQFRRWTPDTVMAEAVFGTCEPPQTAEPVDPDLLIVPLLAFDAAGWRLGYGAGYYDRTLHALRARKPVLAVGVAFAAQEVPDVPHDDTDERLDWIVTERGAARVTAAES